MSERFKKLVGHNVIVRGPYGSWEGFAIAHVDSPSILIEMPSGTRMTLPAEWAELTPAPTERETP